MEIFHVYFHFHESNIGIGISVSPSIVRYSHHFDIEEMFEFFHQSENDTNKFQLCFDNKHMRKIEFQPTGSVYVLNFTLYSIFHAAAKHSMSMHRIFANDTHLFSLK